MVGWLVFLGILTVCFGVGAGNPFIISAGFILLVAAWDYSQD